MSSPVVQMHLPVMQIQQSGDPQLPLFTESVPPEPDNETWAPQLHYRAHQTAAEAWAGIAAAVEQSGMENLQAAGTS